MCEDGPDPWQVASRWYERRKRDLLLAALPRERYAHGFEPGCGNGETTQRLLQRCERLCAVDFSARAVDLCRSEEHTSGLQSPDHLVCRLLLEKKKELAAG